MKKTHSILLNVAIDVRRAKNNKRIAWIEITGWKYGVVEDRYRFQATKPIVQKGRYKMERLGKAIFKAAHEIFKADPSLKDVQF
jgi:hypothetical protein